MIPNSLITNPLIIREAIKYYQKTKLDDRWDRFIKESEKPQRQYRVKMREVFANQLDDILGILKRKSVKADESIGYIDENNLADWNQYRITYNEFGQLTLPGIMGAWADLELQALEVGISFDVLNPKVMQAVTNRSNLFSDSVINETRTLLHTVINDSMNAGDGIPQLRKKIQLLYENMSKYRATRIARTEAIWALNEGAEQGYIQSGVVEFKQWWTARDERRCLFCAEMHGKQIPVGTNYFNLGQSLTIPNPKGLIFVQTKGGGYHYEVSMKASPTLTMNFYYEDVRHPPLHPHCRCTLIPIVFDMPKPVSVPKPVEVVPEKPLAEITRDKIYEIGDKSYTKIQNIKKAHKVTTDKFNKFIDDNDISCMISTDNNNVEHRIPFIDSISDESVKSKAINYRKSFRAT